MVRGYLPHVQVSNLANPDYLTWLVVYPPLWRMMEFVSWYDDLPNWMESHNPFMFQTTNQWLCLSASSISSWKVSRTDSITSFHRLLCWSSRYIIFNGRVWKWGIPPKEKINMDHWLKCVGLPLNCQTNPNRDFRHLPFFRICTLKIPDMSMFRLWAFVSTAEVQNASIDSNQHLHLDLRNEMSYLSVCQSV